MVIRVHGSDGYGVTVGRGLLERAGEVLRDLGVSGRVFLVTDENVAPLWLGTAEDAFVRAGFAVSVFVLTPGESEKNPGTLLRLWEEMTRVGLRRTDTAAALGGGVAGDLAGFAAATYMRGIRFIQIPTTLLAMTDSSVGGKCGIDLPLAKNAVGAIRRPAAVLCDPDVLRTLPPEEYACGMAEVIKYAFVCRPALLELLETGSADDTEVIAACVDAKKRLVEEDEQDTGIRRILNFGHTVGHAVELVSDYSIPHGRAVAAGCAIVSRACAVRGFCDPSVPRRMEALLERYGLPTGTDLDAGALCDAMRSDKKRTSDRVTLILLRAPGEPAIAELEWAELPGFLHDGGVR